MTSYAASIDQTPAGQGVKLAATAGSGGVTAGYAVKYSAAGIVVAVTANTDIAAGVALETATSGTAVTVLGPGCVFNSGQTITVGGRVQFSAAGVPTTYTSGTVLGVCIDGTASASKVLIAPSYTIA